MYRLSRLRCQVCQHPSTIDNEKQPSTYRFRPCAKMKRQASSPWLPSSDENSDKQDYDDAGNASNDYDSEEFVLPRGTRLHCPKLTWPLPDNEFNKFEEYVCDRCLHQGLLVYNWSILERRFAALRQNSYETSGKLLKVPIASEIKGSFPPLWDGLVSVDVLNQILAEYIEPTRHYNTPTEALALPETEWAPRLSEGPHRNLHLWIPCCKLCRLPSLRNNDEGGFADLEFSPSSLLWKWLARLPERPGVSTTITTGFLIKPCAECIQREMVLRVKVTKFLKNPTSPAECDHAKSWSIWHWLQLRSAPSEIDFWHHELPNVAVPGYDRPDWVKFLGLMAEGWFARTGVAWEDLPGVLEPAMAKGMKAALMMMGHDDGNLVELGQWEELVKMVNPVETIEPPVLSEEQLRLLDGVDEVEEELARARTESADGEMSTTKQKQKKDKKKKKKKKKKERVELMTIPQAMGKLRIKETSPKDLPTQYKIKIRNAGKRAKRFAIFKGIYVDPDTGNAVVKRTDTVVPPTTTPSKRKGDKSRSKAVNKRVRLLEDDGIHGTESPVQSAQAMADRYQTPDTPHPSWPLPDRFQQVPEDGALVRCHCRYVHHPMGALYARASYNLPFGLREDEHEDVAGGH